MHGVARMEENGGRPGGNHGRSDLPGHDARLSHTGNDYLAGAIEQQLHSLGICFIGGIASLLQSPNLELKNSAYFVLYVQYFTGPCTGRGAFFVDVIMLWGLTRDLDSLDDFAPIIQKVTQCLLEGNLWTPTCPIAEFATVSAEIHDV